MNVTYFTTTETQTLDLEKLESILESKQGVVWLDIEGPSDEGVTIMETVFEFHPLAIEDTRNQNQRPKAEEYAEHLFVILNPFHDLNGELFRELDVFVGSNYVVTVHPSAEPTLDQTRQRLSQFKHHVPKSSTELLYLLFDVVVDDYFPTLESIEEEIEAMEQQILAQPDDDMLNRLFQLRRILNEFWRVTRPQQDISSILMNHHLVFITEDNQYYLRDVADHLLQISDMIMTLRETITNLVNLYLSVASNRLNLVVTRLTMFTIMIGALTVISGFYGMNFSDTFPPFGSDWAVPLMLVVMAGVIVGILVLFRRKGWY